MNIRFFFQGSMKFFSYLFPSGNQIRIYVFIYTLSLSIFSFGQYLKYEDYNFRVWKSSSFESKFFNQLSLSAALTSYADMKLYVEVVNVHKLWRNGLSYSFSLYASNQVVNGSDSALFEHGNTALKLLDPIGGTFNASLIAGYPIIFGQNHIVKATGRLGSKWIFTNRTNNADFLTPYINAGITFQLKLKENHYNNGVSLVFFPHYFNYLSVSDKFLLIDPGILDRNGNKFSDDTVYMIFKANPKSLKNLPKGYLNERISNDDYLKELESLKSGPNHSQTFPFHGLGFEMALHLGSNFILSVSWHTLFNVPENFLNVQAESENFGLEDFTDSIRATLTVNF